MENKELLSLFTEIDKLDNGFDRHLALRDKRKEYKKSDFYKRTKMSIFRAYRIYQADGLSNLLAFINSPVIRTLIKGDTFLLRLNVENFLADFDLDKIDRVIDHILNRFDELELDTSNITTELQKLIKEFSRAVNK